MDIISRAIAQIDRDFPISHKQRSKPQPDPAPEKTLKEHIRPKWMTDENSITLGQLLRNILEGKA